MRGFLVGTLTLVALEVFTRSSSSRGVAEGTNALVRLLRRAMSPDVPLIPDLAGRRQRRSGRAEQQRPRFSATSIGVV